MQALATPAQKQAFTPRRIELTHIEINDERVLVMSDPACTVFVDERSISLNPDALLPLYKQTFETAKMAGAKLTYQRGTKKKIAAIMPELKRDLAKHERLYALLKAGWEQKVEDGIYSGYCDDEELDRLASIKHQMQRLHYRSTPIGQAQSIQSDLTELKQSMNNVIARNIDLTNHKFAI